MTPRSHGSPALAEAPSPTVLAGTKCSSSASRHSSAGTTLLRLPASAAREPLTADVITHSLQIDATDEKALRAAAIQDVDVAVVSIGENIESSLAVVMQPLSAMRSSISSKRLLSFP